MRRKAIGLVIIVTVAFIAFWLWQFLKPSDIVEVQARVLPMGWKRCMLCDLDGDGNDEVVAETTSISPFTGKSRRDVTAVTMRQGRFVTFPVPLADVQTSRPKGRRLIGKTKETKAGDFAVAELQSNGEWRVQVLSPNTSIYAIGDVDGSGQDDDAFVFRGSNGERMLWFQRQPNGQWRKAGELTLPIGKGQVLSHNVAVKEWGVQVALMKAHFPQLPLLFWDGKWHIGKTDERVKDLNADWDGDGRNDRLIVRYFSETVTFLFRCSSDLRSQKQTLRFGGWKVMDATATNELGDRRWHLLLLMMKSNPPTMRVLDCHFEPSKGCQPHELGRWKMPRTFDHIQFLAGNGQIVVIPEPNYIRRREREETGVWRLLKTGSGWTPQFLPFPYRQDATFMASAQRFGNRFWFYRTLYRVSARGVHGPASAEVGFFRDDGQWQPKIQSPNWLGEWVDLDEDDCPDFLTFQGLLQTRPILWHRLPDGQWRERKLSSPSLYRILGSGLRQADLVVTPDATLLVQWDNKKWFVIVWDDGFMQAVTVKGSRKSAHREMRPSKAPISIGEKMLGGRTSGEPKNRFFHGSAGASPSQGENC